MSEHTAIRVMREIDNNPTYLSCLRPAEGQNADMPELRSLAAADPVREMAAAAARQGEMLANYGFGQSQRDSEKPFAYSDGVAIIPIHGILVNRFAYSWGFVTGYNFLRAQVQAAQEDQDVKLIVFDVDSPGGLVAGCQETADVIYASRAIKPSLAVVDSYAFSAAYFLASQASKISISPSAELGSIGTIVMRMDYTEMLAKAGVKAVYIYAGDHKTDGYPYTAMSKGEQARTQKRIDAAYDSFVAAVARGRGISEDAVINTQADRFGATDALQSNLADVIVPADAAIQTELGCDQPDDEDDDPMATAPTPAEVEAAAAARASEIASAVSAAQTAERSRIMGILGCDEAKGKGSLAQALANTSMSIDEAKVLLKAAAPEVAAVTTPSPEAIAAAAAAAAAGGNPLEQAMRSAGTPGVGADSPGKGEDKSPEAQAATLLGDYTLATGRQFKKAS
jgi:capsid assembly protease